jgi:hypothetical protein
MSTPKKHSSTSHTTSHAAHPEHAAHPARATHGAHEAAAETETTEAAPQPSVATSTAAAQPPAPSASAIAAAASATPNVVLVQLPPADANVPIPPKGFVATQGTDYRGIVPKKAELAVLPQTLQELGRFTNWTQVFGTTAPPLASLQQTLNAALEWSLMRNSTDAWDLYSRTMEGIAWTEARAMMDRFKATFDAAVAADSTVQSQNPSLAALLGAAKAIAQRGVATRKANAQARAKGEAPVKGKAVQKVKRAQKIVADAAERAGVAGAGAPASSAVAPAPSASSAAPVASPSPVATSQPSGTNGATH